MECPDGAEETCDADTPALLQVRLPEGQQARAAAEAVAAAQVSQQRSASAQEPLIVRVERQGRKEQPRTWATEEQCSLVSDLLKNRPHVGVVAQLWKRICEHWRHEIPDLASGCLYVPSDRHMSELFAYVEHPSPARLAGMFSNSFFPQDKHSRCPSEKPGQHASAGGIVIDTCPGGFVSDNGWCIQAKPVSEEGNDHVKVYVLYGSIGLPREWIDILVGGSPLVSEQDEDISDDESADASDKAAATWRSSTRLQRPKWLFPPKPHRKKPQHQRPEAVIPTEPVTIKVNFTVCSSKHDVVDVTEKQLDDQVAVLNAAYSGQQKCQNPLYELQYEDMMIRFERIPGITRVRDNRCSSSCFTSFTQKLLNKYVPYKNGQIKVFICDDSSILGASAFPWKKLTQRGIWVQPGTLPGGKMYGFNKGDTLAHELGHYLGLFHTFQDGCSGRGDGVGDTNPEANSNFGTPAALPTSCGSPDPVHNFMDYVDDKWMCSFTKQQRTRVWRLMHKYLQDLLPAV